MQNAKLTLKLTALAGVAATTATHAAITISPTVGGGISNADWDVDGNMAFDFQLDASTSTASFDDINGGRLVVPSAQPEDGISKLSAGFVVGPTMTGFKFHISPQGGNSIVTGDSVIAGDAAIGGWSYGETGYFGFKFTSGASTHYGWGELSIGGPGIFTVTQAYYESTPDTAITVGSTTAIPEPASAAALLGLGAAGIAAWRRRRAA